MNTNNTSAIVTGAASGLGAAVAEALARNGSKVSMLDINTELLQETAKRIGGFAIQCDVSDETSARRAISQAKDKHGHIRILINCAGIGGSARICGKNGPLGLAEFEKVIRVNLIGTFNMMRLVANEMINSPALDGDERGIIINTASVAAYEGQIGQAAYSASKGGIVSLTLPAAREFAQFGIRVNTIAPGLFLTPLIGGLTEEARQSLSASIPFPKRLGAADEFASLALHVIDNNYINGETIRIDGSLRMQPK